MPVDQRDELPTDPRRGALVVVGDCGGLYRGAGATWQVLEATPARGRHHLRVRWNDSGRTGLAPLLVLGRDEQQVVVSLRRIDPEQVEVRVSRGGQEPAGRPRGVIRVGREHDVVVTADPQVQPVKVAVDGTQVAFAYGPGPPVGDAVLGTEPGAAGDSAAFPGAVTRVDGGAPICERLVAAGP